MIYAGEETRNISFVCKDMFKRIYFEIWVNFCFAVSAWLLHGNQ